MIGKPINLINNIQLKFFISMLLLSGMFLTIQISSHNNKFKKQSEFIQKNYVNEQKAIIKREVERVVELIDFRINTLEFQIEEIIKLKVNEAYSIAENIYEENKEIKTDSEIMKMIKDTLRPIRFENNLGYLFIFDYSGQGILNVDRPELEGQDLYDMEDFRGQYIVRDMINLSIKSGEGLYEYLWTKPDVDGDEHKKISFIKHFEPFDWIIGTGLYVEDIKENVKIRLLSEISKIRFGIDGYLFVNTLDGYSLVSNGMLMPGNKKLWEVYDENPIKIRELFNKLYAIAIKPEGDFIYYSFTKIDDLINEYPKASYVYGLPKINWLVGAGVYLNEIDLEIAKLQEISQKEVIIEIRNTIMITMVLVAVFLFILSIIRKRLQKDFQLFANFFDGAVFHDAEIDLNLVKYQEMIILADRANKMQLDKIEAQQSLVEEKEKLRVSESKFRLLAENSKDMIFRMTIPKGRFEYISPASIDILGYTPQQIIAKPYQVRKLVHPDWKEWVDKKLEEIITGNVEDMFEYQIINKSGKEVWLTQKNTLIKDDNGKVIALVGRLSDETMRKKIEEQLKHSYRMDAIGQLAGGVAHDFNNVLAGIINAAQVLKSPKREIDDKGEMMVDLIMKAAIRAADLTAKLSTFSRKRTLVLKPIDVHHILDETSTILKRTIDKKIQLIIDKKARKSVVIGDGTELQSAILNLGINASHAMADGGEIHIKTSNVSLDQAYCDDILFDVNPGEFIQIDVLDEGSGIKSEDLKRIFEPFFSTKEQGKGTGLGLATVYGAVLDHHGIINVESEVGKGTLFQLFLPCSHEFLEITDEPEEIIQGVGRILLVDDEEIIRFTGKNMLEDMGYTVLVEENGKKAVELFEAMFNEIDLVIMDMIMPEMNGSEAFYKMREIDPMSKIIIISGYTRNESIDELKEAGLSGFLKKPFSDVELNRMIENVLGE